MIKHAEHALCRRKKPVMYLRFDWRPSAIGGAMDTRDTLCMPAANKLADFRNAAVIVA